MIKIAAWLLFIPRVFDCSRSWYQNYHIQHSNSGVSDVDPNNEQSDTQYHEHVPSLLEMQSQHQTYQPDDANPIVPVLSQSQPPNSDAADTDKDQKQSDTQHYQMQPQHHDIQQDPQILPHVSQMPLFLPTPLFLDIQSQYPIQQPHCNPSAPLFSQTQPSHHVPSSVPLSKEFGAVNENGVPISIANALALFCAKTRIPGSQWRRLDINRYNLHASDLNIFSKIRIKKTEERLEFWIETKEQVSDFKQAKAPNGCYQDTSRDHRWPFGLQHQLEIVTRYLKGNGWIGPRITTDDQGFEWYEFQCNDRSDDRGGHHDVVRKWLNDVVELPEYYDIFIEHGFDDMRLIKNVTNEDLKEIGIDKLGHRKKLLRCIQGYNDFDFVTD